MAYVGWHAKARQILEEDENEPPVAELTPVRDDGQSDMSVLDLNEDIPHPSERRPLTPMKIKPLAAFLVSTFSLLHTFQSFNLHKCPLACPTLRRLKNDPQDFKSENTVGNCRGWVLSNSSLSLMSCFYDLATFFCATQSLIQFVQSTSSSHSLQYLTHWFILWK